METHEPRGLFVAADGSVYPDSLICSGLLPADLGGQACPYADQGRMPLPQALCQEAPGYSIDKGQPGDLCPPCAKQQLSALEHWQDGGEQQFPPELLPLRLFKCRQWFWLVVPGVYDSAATVIEPAGGAGVRR